MKALCSITVFLTLTAVLTAPGKAQNMDWPVKYESEGLRLWLAPLSADQVKAFFMGRGFSARDANFLAREACMFRSSIGNGRKGKNAPKVKLRLADWRIITKDKARPFRLREEWEKIWMARGASEEARTGFFWALFPSVQTFGAEDYNWGMFTFTLPAGSRFSLRVVWRSDGAKHRVRIDNLQCAG